MGRGLKRFNFGKETKIDDLGYNPYGSKPTRRLKTSERHNLYDLAKHKCENCGKRITEAEMQEGHKKAYSKGGKTTLANAVCLCYGCNLKQSTNSWEKFRKIQNKPVTPTATSHLKITRTRIATTKKKPKRRQSNPYGLSDDYLKREANFLK